jgi:hypothetical protein
MKVRSPSLTVVVVDMGVDGVRLKGWGWKGEACGWKWMMDDWRSVGKHVKSAMPGQLNFAHLVSTNYSQYHILCKLECVYNDKSLRFKHRRDLPADGITKYGGCEKFILLDCQRCLSGI